MRKSSINQAVSKYFTLEMWIHFYQSLTNDTYLKSQTSSIYQYFIIICTRGNIKIMFGFLCPHLFLWIKIFGIS